MSSSSSSIPECSNGVTHGWTAVDSTGGPLVLKEIQLPPLNDNDVEVRVQACGLCYSDVSAVGQHAAFYKFPLVCGHEGVGVVTVVGKSVSSSHIKVGDRVGLGVYRQTCQVCQYCTKGQDNLCPGKTLMFQKGNSGAFGQHVRIRSEWAYPIPPQISTLDAGPLLCAGVTVFAPFRVHNIQPGQRIGIVGIGGLGHLAIQIGNKYGCEVTCISTTDDKRALSLSLGAHRFILTSDKSGLTAATGTLDYIFVTSNSAPDYSLLLNLLAPSGKIIVMGIDMKPVQINMMQLLMGQKAIVGSAAGSASVAQDVLRFCALHGIKPMIEKFKFSDINTAIKLVSDNKVRFRAVLVHDETLL